MSYVIRYQLTCQSLKVGFAARCNTPERRRLGETSVTGGETTMPVARVLGVSDTNRSPTMSGPTPLDETAFLARSPHRLAVLTELSDGGLSRRELHDRTGISQPTLGRILSAFGDRKWVVKDGRTFSLSPGGKLLVAEFDDLLETVETVQRFGRVAPYLPVSAFSFDLRSFRDARITTPRAEDVFAHVRRGEELLVAADAVRLCAQTMHPGLLAEVVDRIGERPQTHEAVLAADALDAAVADAETAALVRKLARADGVTLYRYDGAIPTALGMLDGLAILLPTDEFDRPCALVESDDSEVREWVSNRIDDYREAATRVTADEFTA